MNDIQHKFLEIFKKRRISLNGLLINHFIQVDYLERWTEWELKEVDHAIEYLIKEKYIENNRDGYVFLQKGYDYFFHHVTLDGVMQDILYLFRDHHLNVGGILTIPQFMNDTKTWYRGNLDKIDKTINKMVGLKYIEITKTGYRLLQKGKWNVDHLL